MLQDIKQVQSAPITDLKLTHFVGLMTFTKDQFAQTFTTENPAPAKVAEQLSRYLTAYTVLDNAYRADKYSLDTEKLKNADEACDHIFMGIKKMTQAQQAFEFNLAVKAAADRMMQCIDKFEIDVAEDYLGENNKLQQFLVEISGSAQLTADAQTLGLTDALTQLDEQVTLLRDLLTQRGNAKPSKGAMKAARVNMEPEYRWLIAILNAAALMNSDEHAYETLVNTLNNNIDYLRVHALKDGGATEGGGGTGTNENENGGGGTNENENQNENGGGTEQGGGSNDNPGGGDNNGGGSGGDNGGGGSYVEEG